MNSPNDNIHTALSIAQNKKICIWALGKGACLKSYIFSHKLTIARNSSMHSLCICIGKWGLDTVSVLELVPSIKIIAWATGTSLHSMEKTGTGLEGRTVSSSYCWSFLYQVLWL